MSVRAHRVIKIETAGESFNISQNQQLMDFIISNSYDDDISSKLDESQCGIFEVPVTVLKQAIGEIPLEFCDPKHNEEPQYANFLDESDKKSIKADIEFAEKNCDDYVMYYSY